jgi:hypothetical protein
MRYTPRVQASGERMGTPALNVVAYITWRLNSPNSCYPSSP